MTRLLDWYTRLRQWTYPSDFRIEIDHGVSAPDGPFLAMIELLERSQHRGAGDDTSAKRSTLDKDFVVKLCNEHASARRSAGRMGSESKESRSINRTLKRVDGLLRDHHVECLDLEGEEYTPARDDFEPIGEPEPVPGLEHMTIGICERPKVVMNGRLIQRATGILQRPA